MLFHIKLMKLWKLLVRLHLFLPLELSPTHHTNVHYWFLHSGLFLPLFSHNLSLPSSILFFSHLSWSRSIFLHLLLSLFFQLLYCDQRPLLFLFYLQLPLPVVIILHWSLWFSLPSPKMIFPPFPAFVREWLSIVILRFVSRVHHRNFFPLNSKIRVCGIFVCDCCLFCIIELNKSEILKLAGHFVLNHPDILDRGKLLKKIEKDFFLSFHDDRPPHHQTTSIDVILLVLHRLRLRTVVKFAVVIFLILASITLISSGEIFVVASIAVPIIGHIKIDPIERIVVNAMFCSLYWNLLWEKGQNGRRDFSGRISGINVIFLQLNLIWYTSTCSDTCID